MLKLADRARKNALNYKTAHRFFRSGRFPRPVEQLPTAKSKAKRALEAAKR